MNPSLRKFSQASLPLQASKWLQIPLLLDSDEMKDLFDAMGDFWIALATGVTKEGEGFISKEEFLDCYQAYVNALKSGQMPTDPRIRPYFSSVLTCTLDALYTVSVGQQQQLLKVDKPVIQLQLHRFDYSQADGKFRSMVFGQNSIFWGVQFSYPQLYQDEKFQVKQVRETEEFPNTALFKRLQKWMRAHTVATPFIVENKLINVPIRLGKKCFAWINHHPQLKPKLEVKGDSGARSQESGTLDLDLDLDLNLFLGISL
jgi:hypothetical protein